MQRIIETTRRSLPTLVLVLALAGVSTAQGVGGYFNVESPQVSPLAMAEVAGEEVLLVCNTPDGSLELWSTSEAGAGPALIQRLRVGLEPISVHAVGDRFWVANFLGDSVMTGIVEPTAGPPVARLLAGAGVGDEPMDIAFYDDEGVATIFVTLHSTSGLAWLNADTLAPHVGGGEAIDLVQNPDPTPFDPPWGLKHPRAVRVDGGAVHVIGLKGGVTHPDSTHDLDILVANIADPLEFGTSIANLGSTNFNGRFDAFGGLWVVGGEAQNFDNDDKIAVRDETSGFVQSTLYYVVNPRSAPRVIERRDVNLRANGSVVGKAGALAMPTDVAIQSNATRVTKVFVAAFSSDRIGVFEPPFPLPVGGGSIDDWDRGRMGYGGAPVGGNPRWGPRGLLLADNVDGTERLYVLNRLDNSFSIFDPEAEIVVSSHELGNDPTPDVVRRGREFLYSADESGTGFVSCASCHVDGGLDGLSWKLGNPSSVGPLEPDPDPLFVFGLAGTGLVGNIQNPCPDSDPCFFLDMFLDRTILPWTWVVSPDVTFDPDGVDDKREMITQSLQGLSNFEVAFDDLANEPEQADLVRRLFHNAPFHWRGDKPSLRHFNEAFVTLLLGDDEPGPNPEGLTEEEMNDFETAIHSIHYPPNPRQPRDRTYSPDNGGFNGGAEGLRLFHTLPIDVINEQSCVHCHSLPEGSNNRLSVFFTDFPRPGYVSVENRQPIETAALRGLLQKEPLLEPNGNFPNNPATTPVLAHFGMNHMGIQPFSANQNPHTSLNLFADTFFAGATGSPQARSVKQFLHEFDWGAAPVIGAVAHVRLADIQAGTTEVLDLIVLMQEQAREANAGLVVWGEFPGQPDRGWVYAPTFDRYIEEPGFTPSRLGQLGALVAGDQDSLTFFAVPLGSERRLAHPDGDPGGLPQVTPGNVSLLSMLPNTANETVPTLRDNWVLDDAPSSVTTGVTQFFDFNEPLGQVDSVFPKTLRLFQYGLTDAVTNGNTRSYGVDNLRHEAPRRLRVQGTGIFPGAKLLLTVFLPEEAYAGPPPSDPIAQADETRQVVLELPLFPTGEVADFPIWETEVELGPFQAYVMMLGGPRAPGVQETIDGVISLEYGIGTVPGLPPATTVIEPTATLPIFASPFDPDDWNWYGVQVRNPGPNGPNELPLGPVSAPDPWEPLVM